MSRRKDNKGRVLRTGESQRKDLIYQYRYTDALGNRKCIYASDLKILREKEDELQRSLEDGLDYAGGEITVYELLQRYLSLKCGVRYNTKVGYGFVMNIVQKEPFGARKIRDIKVSDAQRWMIKLQKEGKGYSTLTSIRGVVKPAFQMAYNEEVVRRNPFDFKLTDVVANDSQKRISLTEKQQKVWMNFIREDKSYAKYYDEFVVLLGTGMRVSEFCGLTLQDLDFQNRKIRVDHQLIRESGGKYYVEKTKTECGRRCIPMTEDVFQSLQNLLANRKRLKNEVIIDGYSGFLLLDKNDHPKVALHIENEMRWAMKKYRKLYPDAPLPHITPHVFRHTFCTTMANAGMDIKESDAQRWMIKLQKEGKGYSTLTSIRGVVKPAFQMAYNEEVVRRNPFDFKLTDVVVNDSRKRISLTEKQQKVWMNFIREDKSYTKYYDEFVVLLGTGMRVSEFCGLTLQDLDFQNRRIRVDHQLIRESGGKYYVEKTKTECGRRFIPMTEEVFQSLQNLRANRKRLKNEVIIDGYSGFLLLDKNDHPKVALHIENEMRWAMKKYRKLYPDAPLPHITPHVFRHTFCTNMANVGMDIKALQYVMGHSDASITLNVYTHASYDHAAEQMTRLVDFLGSSDRQERKMSG